MCCFAVVLGFLGPRAAILVWWLVDTTRWEAAFDNFFWALLGFFLAPWTTLGWAAVAGSGVSGFDWIILGLAVLLDVFSWTGGGMQGRRQYA
jgi:hypothetical protein